MVKLPGLGKRSSGANDDLQIMANLPIRERRTLITQPNINHLTRMSLIIEERVLRSKSVSAPTQLMRQDTNESLFG